MSKYILLVGVAVAGSNLRPGTVLDSAQDAATISDIQDRFGDGVALWPQTDAIVAGAAEAVASLAKNHPDGHLSAILVAAAAKSVSEGAATSASDAADSAAAAAAASLTIATITVDYTDFAELANGTKTNDYTLSIPTGARLLVIPIAESFTGFDDATHGTMAATLGTSAGGNQIGTSLNLAAGQTGFPKAFSAGSSYLAGKDFGGSTFTLRFTSSVDLNTLTAGHVVVQVLYAVPLAAS